MSENEDKTKQWGINLENRKMRWIPYAHSNDYETVNDISADSVISTLSFFRQKFYEKYPDSEENPVFLLVDLLNKNTYSPEYLFTPDLLFNKDYYYSIEAWFYINQSMKLIINDYSFCYTSDTQMYLSGEHKIWEKGFIDSDSIVKSDDKVYKGINTNFIKLLIDSIKDPEQKKHILDELISWLNLSLKKKSNIFTMEVIYNEFNYLTIEVFSFIIEFLKILTGDNNLLQKNLKEINFFSVGHNLLLGLNVKTFFKNYSSFIKLFDSCNDYSIMKLGPSKAIIKLSVCDNCLCNINHYYFSVINIIITIYTNIHQILFNNYFKRPLKEIKATPFNKFPKRMFLIKIKWNRIVFNLKSLVILSLIPIIVPLCTYFLYKIHLITSYHDFVFISIIFVLALLFNQIFMKFYFYKKIYIISRKDRQYNTLILQQLHAKLLREKEELEDKVIERTIELQDAKDKIEYSSLQKTYFFTNLAHEMKTPLTLISNYLNAYMKENKSDNKLIIIKNNIDKLKDYMLDYLDIEKLEQGKHVFDHTQINNFTDLLLEKCELFKQLARRKNISLTTDIEQDISINIDSLALEKVINNLIGNSIKYTPNNGMVSVVLKKKDTDIFLEVKDSGIGIPANDIDRIFDLFYQTTNKDYNIHGIGIGLTIVKEIINSLGGSITVSSKKNEGSTFTVLFPLSLFIAPSMAIPNRYNENKSIISTHPRIIEQNFDPAKKIILIVEDEYELLSFLYDSFSTRYNVFYAINGKEALEKINYIPMPDIIISDVMMNFINGYEFYDALLEKTNYHRIPFIFLTAKTSLDDRLKGLSCGAIDYISKPFLIEELLVKVESILTHSERQHKSLKSALVGKIASIINEENDQEHRDYSIPNNFVKYKISKREMDIVKKILAGKENKEIAHELNISVNTVRNHINNIYMKCGVRNRIDLVNLLNK